jgi:hypothetical protein
LTKAAVKSVVAAKLQRKRFVASVHDAKQTPAWALWAGQLVRKARAAKAAKFLERYRRYDNE